jgi:hypothetical protein
VRMNPVTIMAPILGAMLLFWLLSRLILSEASEDRRGNETEGGRVEFTPNRRSFWGVYLFIACLAYLILSAVLDAFKSPTDIGIVVFCAVIILLLLAAFPGSIVVTSDGLEQLNWLRMNKRILWREVKTVSVSKKNSELVITGPNGTKICHRRQLPDRVRLIAELQRHCANKLPIGLAQEILSGS